MTINRDIFEKIVSLTKRRGFVFPGSDIYGGLAGTWDYGPLGVLLKENIKQSWFYFFVGNRPGEMYAIDSAVLMNLKVWETAGHVKEFSDPMVDCRKCRRRFRAGDVSNAAECPSGGVHQFTDARPFNMLFKTWAGPVEEDASQIYLRPENAQGIFVNFKNIIDTFHPSLPFGVASIGKVFRNEISPGEFLFRAREFEIMEFEYFTRKDDWENSFEQWKEEMLKWAGNIGIPRAKLHLKEVPANERAHYSARTVDIEYEYPFGIKEMMAIAYRQDYDLSRHMEQSGVDLRFTDAGGNKFLPHVVEPTFGLDRIFMAVISEAYREDRTDDNKERVVLSLKAHLAPVKVAVFPLLANKEQIVTKARSVFDLMRANFSSVWDDIGNIGKRYRRQDEIGTPWCVTIDYQTLEDDTVTVRDRDTMKQDRFAIADLKNYFYDKLSSSHRMDYA